MISNSEVGVHALPWVFILTYSSSYCNLTSKTIVSHSSSAPVTPGLSSIHSAPSLTDTRVHGIPSNYRRYAAKLYLNIFTNLTQPNTQIDQIEYKCLLHQFFGFRMLISSQILITYTSALRLICVKEVLLNCTIVF